MRALKSIVSLLFALAIPAGASDLSLTVGNHNIVRADQTSMPTLFVEERVVAKVKLDVFMVSSFPSSSRGYAELSKLDQTTWIEALQWSLRDANGNELPVPAAKVLSSRGERRGPDAPSGKQWTVPGQTFEGRFDLGPLPPGDYRLQVSVPGLSSDFPIAVRTGDEPLVRDAYLEMKASKASSYEEFTKLQLERYENDPSRVGPLFAVMERAMREGTLEETKRYLSMIVATMDERRERGIDPDFSARRIQELREVESVLPDYFARRRDWIMVPAGSAYEIRERRSGTVVRRVGETSKR